MNKKVLSVISVIFQSAVITFLTLLCVIPFSCKTSVDGIQIIGGDFSAPVLEKMDVLSEKLIQVKFSEAVNLTEYVVSPVLEDISSSTDHSTTPALSVALQAATGCFGRLNCEAEIKDEGKTLLFNIPEGTEVGKNYELYGVVEDSIGNSLTFCIPFTGYNENVPRVIFTEINPLYKSVERKGEEGVKDLYGEFVEILCLDEGNLSGITLSSASKGEKSLYKFPPVDVKKGDVLVVHLRNTGEDTGAVSELGTDLLISTAPYSSSVRDLWTDYSTSICGKTSDVLILEDSINNKILDGIIYSKPKNSNITELMENAAEQLINAGIYDEDFMDYMAPLSYSTQNHSMKRSDAGKIYEGIINDCEIEFPLSVTPETWTYTAESKVSPGEV